ncbi:hypothetical protein GCM10009721_38490 [Terrabacter tumescens]|uniref:Uncharacterized protein n=1 Tax=Terrabacter tumescens TaxID=60443 RepID=A0ABQ2IE00_9MICO|nr:hypothetical protein GCM10009721_38490 [Terrabacter tumescens]
MVASTAGVLGVIGFMMGKTTTDRESLQPEPISSDRWLAMGRSTSNLCFCWEFADRMAKRWRISGKHSLRDGVRASRVACGRG